MQEELKNYFELGNDHFKKGEYDLAIENYLRAVNNKNKVYTNAQLCNIFFNLGEICYKKQNYRTLNQ